MKRKLADVLWDAANVYLCPTGKMKGKTEAYSCPAVALATGRVINTEKVRNFLIELGCDTKSDDLLHKPWKFSRESQGVRYMWLLLAMHVANDEGIIVEVSE